MCKIEIIHCLHELRKIEQNLRKSVNKQISRDTLIKHFNTAEALYVVLENLLDKAQKEIPDKEFFTYLKQARSTVDFIRRRRT